MKGHKVLKLGQKWLYHNDKGELCKGIVTKIDAEAKVVIVKDQYSDDEYLMKMPDLPVETTITPQERRQLKKGLVQRTKVRRRKEDERRQHIYK